MSVILINPFEVATEQMDEALEFWKMAAEHMRKQPGFISTQLHRAVTPWSHFKLINVAEWESVEHFEAVMNSAEFRELTGPYMEKFPHLPGLYEVVRT